MNQLGILLECRFCCIGCWIWDSEFLKGSGELEVLLVYRSQYEWDDFRIRTGSWKGSEDLCPNLYPQVLVPRGFGERSHFILQILDFSSTNWGWDTGVDQRWQILNPCDCSVRCRKDAGSVRCWRQDGHDFQSSHPKNVGGIFKKTLGKLSHVANCDPLTL